MIDIPLDTAIDLTSGDVARASGTLERTAIRLHATPADLDRVRAAVFGGPLQPTPEPAPVPLSQRRRGVAASPADKEIIRRLLADGWETAAIAAHVGCSQQVISGVRSALSRNARTELAR